MKRECLTGKSLSPKEIDLWLEDYNDLFSDFDNRPYIQRGLSDDFLFELRRASEYKDKDGLKLNLFVPKRKRDSNEEKIIKQRLSDHFNRHWLLLEKQEHGIIRKGIVFAVVGFIVMIIVTTFLIRYQNSNLLLSSFIVFLEITGWFMLWEGLNEIIFHSKEIKPEQNFYRKMAFAKVNFLTATKC
jgi:hypothetical protein